MTFWCFALRGRFCSNVKFIFNNWYLLVHTSHSITFRPRTRAVCMSVYLSVYPYVSLSGCLYVCLYVYLFVCLVVCLYASQHVSACLSGRLLTCLAVCLCLSTCLSVCLFACGHFSMPASVYALGYLYVRRCIWESGVFACLSVCLSACLSMRWSVHMRRCMFAT